MSKYYNKKIPTEIHFIYGGRHSGKTYYEFNKIKEENERIKKELEHYKQLTDKKVKLVIQELGRLVANHCISLKTAEELVYIFMNGE